VELPLLQRGITSAVAGRLQRELDKLVLLESFCDELTNPLKFWETNSIDVKFHRLDGCLFALFFEKLEVAS
jgi:hypothetical protein